MKTFSMKIDPLTNEAYWEVYLRGQPLLHDPLLNKGSAFSEEERLSLGLCGLLPCGLSTIEHQKERSMESLRRKPDNMEKYIFLQGLLNRQEVLYYRLLVDHLTELVPIVYTPTVGQACMELSHIARRFRGIYLSPENIAKIDQIFQSISLPSVDLIVVTDGERILGLGDLGADGMGIPVGKVTLYVAAGGLHPACCLPISLDVGTNNQRLLDDPLYLGWRHARLEGDSYWKFIETFVLGVKRNFPEALVQWEDFAKHKAFSLLDRYRDRVLSFDDDIQGTGSVALAVLMTAMRIKKSRFADQRFLIAGQGQAGVGIGLNILAQLKAEGLSAEEAGRRIFTYDLPGMLLKDTPGLSPWQQPLAQDRAAVAGWTLRSPDRIDLVDIIRNAKPTVLIGVTARPGLFSGEVLEAMAASDAQPVIMPLSNPTSKVECTAQEIAKATDGRALVATGSPFADIPWGDRTLVTSQCNNLYVFPGVGLGALVAKATKVTHEMFLAASRALSAMVTPEQEARGYLLPPMQDIRAVSRAVAKAVAVEARDAGLGRLLDDPHYDLLIAQAQWDPQYAPFRPRKGTSTP